MLDLKVYIRDIPDFPKPGILFRDITPLLADRQALAAAVYQLAGPYHNQAIDAVVAVEARGFIFGAAVAISTVGVVSTGFAVISGSYSLHYLLRDYLPYYLLLSWSEAFLTGMALTLMVVYRPEWVATFDDARYLGGK